MKVGITAAGAYVPNYRLKRETIARAWERGAIKGERSVANTDEDSLTMAVEAAIVCFSHVNRTDIDALYYASTTAPYAEKSISSIVAAACDLKEGIFTADFSNSTKAGTSALRTALDAVKAGSAQQALTVAADCRNGYPKSDQEQLFGDASAAVAVGSKGVMAELIDSYSVTTEIIDIWRNINEKYINYGEGRFISEKGYMTAMTQAIKALLKKTGSKNEEIQKVVIATPGLKDNSVVAKKTGFSPEQLQESYMLEIGNCGTAQPLLMLVAALEQSSPGDTILLASYGNGADAFLFRVTDEVKKIQANPRFKSYLETKKPLDSYSRFLSFRGLLEAVPGEPFRTFPSNSAYWREQKGILRLHGSTCTQCGQAIFPINRICNACGSKDQFDEIHLSDRTANVFTFSIDYLAGRSDDPLVVQTVAEDGEGVRYYLLMTEFDKNEVKIGMEVNFTFRRIYEGGNYINYYWKCRPVRKAGK